MKFPRRTQFFCRPPDATPLAGMFFLLLLFFASDPRLKCLNKGFEIVDN